MLSQAIAQAASASHETIGLAREDLDITDPDATRRGIAELQPDAVINCAAWTDVDAAEDDWPGALAVNGTGAGNVARAAAAVGATIVHISTDYVFDGCAQRAYIETDAPNPINAYGRSKLAGERAVAAANARHAIVRTSWLFGAGGPNFVATMLRLGAERDVVEVVNDQVGCPTWVGHLAGALLTLAAGHAPGVHHVAGAGACSWHELASETFHQAGVSCSVTPVRTGDRPPRAARRPACSVLRSGRADTPRLPPWQDGLAAYLGERAHLEAHLETPA